MGLTILHGDGDVSHLAEATAESSKERDQGFGV